MRRLLHLLAIPFLAVALLPAASTTTPVRHTAAAHVASPTDAQLEATIRAKLAKSKIGKDGFRFKVSKGIVTWEGTTDVMQHKGSATRMARAAGAVQVVNNIQVSATGKDKAMATLKKAHVQ
jgi:osmotically-inducible protein OsmY